jgi:hypothetical protein
MIIFCLTGSGHSKLTFLASDLHCYLDSYCYHHSYSLLLMLFVILYVCVCDVCVCVWPYLSIVAFSSHSSWLKTPHISFLYLWYCDCDQRQITYRISFKNRFKSRRSRGGIICFRLLSSISHAQTKTISFFFFKGTSIFPFIDIPLPKSSCEWWWWWNRKAKPWLPQTFGMKRMMIDGVKM